MVEPRVKDNIKWAKEEAPYYNAYVGLFNLRMQHYLKKEILRLSRQIDTALPVLDFGSGTGNVARYLEQAGLKTVAMDISLEMLKENSAQNRVIAESQCLPFKDGCFGMITACAVIHHLPNPIRAIQEICRVAASHCVILIMEPVAGSKPTAFPRLTDRILWALWRLIHPKDLKSLLSYIFFHRKRLKKLRANLEPIEKDLDLDSVQELCEVMKKHSFTVQTTFSSGGVSVETYR